MEGGVFNKLKSGAKGARDKAATAALMGSMGSMNPFGKKKGRSSMGSLGSLGALGALGSPGKPTKGNPPVDPNAKTFLGRSLSFVFKLLIFLIGSIFIVIFVAFTIKKNSKFTTKNIIQLVFVVLLIQIFFTGAFFLKVPILDFLISSKINIFCFYMLLTYSSITTVFDNGFVTGLFEGFQFFFDLFSNPVMIFENGARVFFTILFLIVPSLVLLYNFSKGGYQFFLTLVLTFLTGLILLMPNKWWGKYA